MKDNKDNIRHLGRKRARIFVLGHYPFLVDTLSENSSLLGTDKSQIMSADKYPSIFSRQMATAVYLLKTVSLDSAIREFSLGQPSWVMNHYTMLCKYVKQTRDFWSVFIFSLVYFSIF